MDPGQLIQVGPGLKMGVVVLAPNCAAGKDQQMRGNGSPVSQSIMRVPPMGVCICTNW